MRLLKFLLILVVMILGAAFAVMNPDSVRVDYYFGARDLPLSLLLFFSLVLGTLLGMLFSLASILGLKRDNVRLRRRERLAAEEVNNLRNLPIKE